MFLFYICSNRLIDHNLAEEDWRDERCAICQYEFGSEDGLSTSATNPDSKVPPAFRMAPCKNLFHVQDRRDNRPSPQPSCPRPVDDSPHTHMHQVIAHQRAEKTRNRQNNGEVAPAGPATADEQADVENTDDVVRPEPSLLVPASQAFGEEYADPDSPGYSNDDASHDDDDAPAMIPSLGNAPSLTQTTTESEIDKQSRLDAPAQLEALAREFLDADADADDEGEDEDPSSLQKKQKRGWEDRSRMHEESEEVKSV